MGHLLAGAGGCGKRGPRGDGDGVGMGVGCGMRGVVGDGWWGLRKGGGGVVWQAPI